MGVPDHVTCVLRDLYAGLEATVRTGCELVPVGKGVCQAVYCHSVYLTYMQSESCEMPGWMTHKLESRLPG